MKQETLQLTGGNFNNSRRKLDYYPTPRNVTIALLDFLKLPLTYTIWEPACGNGAMSSVFKEYGYNTVETDIIHGQDYFNTFEISDAIITNPPFNLSVQFIEKALTESTVVCMLLKSQYWHAAKRQLLFEKHVLPLTWRPDFLEHERNPLQRKGAPTMEVAWSVWGINTNCCTTCCTIYKPLTKPK